MAGTVFRTHRTEEMNSRGVDESAVRGCVPVATVVTLSLIHAPIKLTTGPTIRTSGALTL